MSDVTPERDAPAPDETDLGSLSIEDDPGGTVDPKDLAGTADESDDNVLHPDHSEADLKD